MSDNKQTQAAHPWTLMLARRELLRRVAVIGAAATAIIADASTPGAEGLEEGEYQCRAVPRPPQGAPSVDFDAFMQTSRTLTGMPLDSPEDLRIGKEYLDRCIHVTDMADNNALPNLIAAYQQMAASQSSNAQAIGNSLVQNNATKAAAEQLIYLWYLSAFYVVPQPDPKNPSAAGSNPAWVYGTPAQYEHALLWKAVNAHPPMLRGGPPGYWAKPPKPIS